jgi:Domain of Unknown Function (DUF1259)
MEQIKSKIVLVILFSLFVIQCSNSQDNKWQGVSDVLQRNGTLKDNVYKVGFPRADLDVKIGDIKIAAGLAFGGWVAFMDSDGMNMESGTMIMGDLVLLESEIPEVQKSLLSNGIKISAIHNHLLQESPKVMYMHIYGNGDKVKLAQSIKEALQKSATILDTNLLPKSSAPQSDWSKVENILNYTGAKKGNLLNLNIPRNDEIKDNGMIIPPFMGVANAINFQMADDKAFTTGDFVLLADEVDNVMNALIQGGFTVTALHSHMLFESPRLFFMHFWGYDSPENLAQTLKSALDKTNYKKNN